MGAKRSDGPDPDVEMVPVTARGRQTRAALLAAAREIFGRTPFSETKITDITRRAGVASGTFYTYFESKEEIFRFVAVDVLDEMSSAPQRRPGDRFEGHFPEIRASTARYFAACLEHAQIARSIEQLGAADPSIAGARRSTVRVGVERSQRWIEDLQANGLCDVDIDPWATALALHTMTVRVAYDHLMHPGGGADLDRLADTVARIWARAIGLDLAS